ncbi:hypothetical protein A3A49_02750 [Candidatus Curtissbacteria bacterium RIFCSPLOWO2_01_FULL_38_11b]|uniref:Uncharacterized protein n=1 Tax=Candidatus Curtissbacteria bacterium RIFCSPLOWO2_01_FULL_38_11b TaxID=1797725 RepID=A0A1F5H154_9BACT|nr:MAG: hypothetical protein A3A49_02750 [Candidatus Curtissbacteria bacterium RIFCSPLOWO2_01_FULL_38_11b]
MAEDKPKTIEKYYIETTASLKKRLLLGITGGIGWGIGLTLGTAAVIVSLGFFVSKIDFVPILGQFLSDVIKESQNNLRIR